MAAENKQKKKQKKKRAGARGPIRNKKFRRIEGDAKSGMG